jgi:hypothetical protein
MLLVVVSAMLLVLAAIMLFSICSILLPLHRWVSWLSSSVVSRSSLSSASSLLLCFSSSVVSCFLSSVVSCELWCISSPFCKTLLPVSSSSSLGGFVPPFHIGSWFLTTCIEHAGMGGVSTVRFEDKAPLPRAWEASYSLDAVLPASVSCPSVVGGRLYYQRGPQ